ncbi:MAG: universal stress protein [Planctomycetota bacterium]|jgi:nucleotide-binding universal stress UspA family protein
MKVLIAVDGSACAFSAVEFVSRLGLTRGGEVTLLTVVPACHENDESEVGRHAEGLMQESMRRLAEKDVNVRCRTRQGHAGHEIVVECQEWGADLVVVGSHGHGALHRFLLGSVSEQVLKHAPCSVLIVRSKREDVVANETEGNEMCSVAGPLRVLVGFDGSDLSQAGIDFVAQLAPANGQEVRIVSVQVVITYFRMDILQKQSPEWLRHKRALSSGMEAAAARLRESALTVSTGVHEGDNEGEELLELADAFHADLVVVGATGRSAVEHFLLGSVSDRIAHHAKSSVLVVRAGQSAGGPSHE